MNPGRYSTEHLNICKKQILLPSSQSWISKSRSTSSRLPLGRACRGLRIRKKRSKIKKTRRKYECLYDILVQVLVQVHELVTRSPFGEVSVFYQLFLVLRVPATITYMNFCVGRVLYCMTKEPSSAVETTTSSINGTSSSKGVSSRTRT